MELKRLLNNLDYELKSGDMGKNISEIKYDSRRIEAGNLFIAISGFQTDGHKYISQAVENGAAAVIIEKDLNEYQPGVTFIKVQNSRKTMAEISKNFFGNPLSDIKLIGVTGTNGKTTTSYILYNILKEYAGKSALFGTIKNIIADKEIGSSRTTPESLDLYRNFAKMDEEGVKYAVMEVSSHALDLYRVRGMEFAAAIFTNLSPEHLDYHKTIDNYRKVKAKLFSQLKKDSFAVINRDDPNFNFIKKKSNGKNYSYSLKNTEADLYTNEFNFTQYGMSYKSSGRIKQTFDLKLGGIFNIYNSLAAVLTADLLGIDINSIKTALKNIQGVPGRFELIDAGQDFKVIVDYAHTPDGMKNVLETAKELDGNNIIVLFGCGGDRDRKKRPEMAKLAEKYADYVVVSNDNPRSESPQRIFSEIQKGFSESFNDYEIIADREAGIRRAVEKAEKDDIVLLLGRGHEKFQILNNKKIELDDRKVAYQAAKSRKK